MAMKSSTKTPMEAAKNSEWGNDGSQRIGGARRALEAGVVSGLGEAAGVASILLAPVLAGGELGLGKAAGMAASWLAWGLTGGGQGSSILAVMASRGYNGVTIDEEMSVFARLAAVSVALQNMGGELAHPMGSTRGKATSGSSPSWTGKTTPSFGISSTARSMR